ncbi:serine carboxypeptidase S28-domain-containing protein [Jimgerdemannia flammicorona]|uniref:Serine carboxypeptidase S28-domain-containing protein n=1 Tax=Jimgerdemannia flammicorona TaxID=994334 RepID=A0A433QV62_9FUNG|nr:serine carboxypeptidase S28-domain-containing protein [Jimgerdemannia flammicorona]
MRPITAFVLAATFLASLCAPSSGFGSDAMFGAVGILHQKTFHSRHKLRRSLTQSAEFGPFYFDQKLDHFHINTTTFRQRYWVNSNHYKTNGPVIFYNAGETDATERGGYVLNSTMHDLAQSLHGIVVVIEHRYYGESTPFSNYTTENLRFLNTDQALEDMANFIRTVKYDDDFASLISYPLGNWQKIIPGDNPFVDFCTIFNNSTTPAEYFDTYTEYLKALIVEVDCPPGGIDACFTTHNPESSMYTDVTSPHRAWTYQTCTEYGYWKARPRLNSRRAHLSSLDAAPKGHTSLLSRKFDINWFQRQCYLTFGEQSITSLVNVEDFNRRYGGWNVKLTHTIWVDGEWDPWRELSVQSPNAPKRESTTTAPLVLIPQAVHRWDFDTGPSVPGAVKQAQVEILGALQSWLKHYYHAHNIELRFQTKRT